MDEAIDRELFAKRLTALLKSEATRLLTRGHQLVAEHEHLLSDARIISDIRPIFDDSVAMEAATIGHTLRLELHGSEQMTIDIALDMLDLERLEKAVARAHAKDAKLREYVRSTNVTLVLPYEVEDSGD